MRWYSKKSVTQTLKEGPHYIDVYSRPPSRHSSISEPASSVYSYHTISSSEARKVCESKMLRTSNLSEFALSTNLVQLPLQKESKVCKKNLPEIYEHCDPLSRPNLCSLPANVSPLYTWSRDSEFNEINRPLKPKRKLNNAVLLPSKCSKKLDANSTVDKDLDDLAVQNKFPRELAVHLQSEQPLCSTPAIKESSELTDSSVRSSPSIKLNRKVIHSAGRSKKGSRKQNTELCLPQTDEAPVPEETKNAQNSSTHALLELFQTSDANSDFGGFSSIPENKDSSAMKDNWEDQHTDVLWSLFSTSRSSSPFIGF